MVSSHDKAKLDALYDGEIEWEYAPSGRLIRKFPQAPLPERKSLPRKPSVPRPSAVADCPHCGNPVRVKLWKP